MAFSLARWGSTGRIHAIEVSEHDAIIVVGTMGNFCAAIYLKVFIGNSVGELVENCEKSSHNRNGASERGTDLSGG
jgi:hypothetical protein